MKMTDIFNTLITMADTGMSVKEIMMTFGDFEEDSNLPSVGRDIEVLKDHVHQKYLWEQDE